MRVLIAPDCFTGTLSAAEAAAAIAEGWHRRAPRDELDLCPLSDGGPGFGQVLAGALGGRRLPVSVRGPLTDGAAGDVPAEVLLVEGPDGVRTGYLESAQACGLALVPAHRRDPGLTTTAGVGTLLLTARSAGATRIVVGLGGSGTNDGGAGLLGTLLAAGGHPATATALTAGGAALAGLSAADLAGLADVVAEWRAAGPSLVAATDVDAPLLGFHGASAGYAAQKGAGPARAQDLERALGDFSRAAVAAVGAPAQLAAAPGAGAAGGLGFGLLLLGATRVNGVQLVLDAVRLTERAAAADLLVTGEGTLDWQSLRGKVVTGVARAGLAVGRPVVAVAGQVEVGGRELRAAGLDGAYPVARTPREVAASLADPAAALAARAERVARTWSVAAGG